jgi:hypothetical protein
LIKEKTMKRFTCIAGLVCLAAAGGCGGGEETAAAEYPLFQKAKTLEKPMAATTTYEATPQWHRKAERMFPERAHAEQLSTGETYDLDSCETVDVERLRDKLRVYYRDLGPFAGILSQTSRPKGPTCASEDCYLRVNTAHMGATLKLGSVPVASNGLDLKDYTDDSIVCDDPGSDLGVSSCHLGVVPGLEDPFAGQGAAAPGGYRGNVIVADRIIINNPVELGTRSLVLIARHGIEFEGDGRIVGARSPKVPVPNWGAHGKTKKVVFEYTQIDGGGPGGAGASSGTVILIAPYVTRKNDSSTLASKVTRVDLRGQAGAEGGSGSNIHCVSTECYNSTLKFNAPGGAGGDGGDGGHFIAITSHYDPGLTTSLGGAGGGGGGKAASVQWGSTQVSLGSDGPAGKSGAAGQTQLKRLGQDLHHYAYTLAKRGADRLMISGRRSARYVDPSTTAGDTGARSAVAELTGTLAGYCDAKLRVVGPKQGNGPVPMQVSVTLKPPGPALPLSNCTFFHLPKTVCAGWKTSKSTTTLPGPRPTTYVVGDKEEERAHLCDEARVRLARVESGQNYVGLDQDFFMYVRPDRILELRNTVFSAFDQHRTSFTAANQAVAAQQALSSSLELESEDARTFQLESRRLALEAARKRAAAAGEKMVYTMGWFKANQDEILHIRQVLQDSTTTIESALELKQKPCDLLCVFGNFFDFMTKVVGAATNAINAVSTAWDSLQNLGSAAQEIKDALSLGKLKENLKNAGKITTSVHEASTIDLLGTFAKQVAHGIPWKKTATRDYPGPGDIAAGVKGFIDSAKAAKAAGGSLSSTAGANPIAAKIADAAVHNASTMASLVDALAQVHTSIASVQAIPAASVVDHAGAMGQLNRMVDLIKMQIELARVSDRLIKEHLMACAEMAIASDELALARLELDRAQFLEDRLTRRFARAAGKAKRAVVQRDSICMAAKPLNDRLLLLDFLHTRARSFASLQQPVGAASNDFRRNLLSTKDWNAVQLASTNTALQDFIAELVGTTSGQVPGSVHESGTGYEKNVLAQLRRSGRAHFAVEEGCEAGSAGAYCNAAQANELPRQRVINFDVELLMASGYRLGCPTSSNCPIPTKGAPDLPMGNGLQYEVKYGHGEVAEFLWDDGSIQQLRFSSDYTTSVCELINAMASGGHDCRGLARFTGASIYQRPSQKTLDGIRALDQASYQDDRMFGTSVRGIWTIDVRNILTSLNGRASDQCYEFAPGNSAYQPLSADCTPDEQSSKALEQICAPYATSDGRLRSHGDPSCCTSHGVLRSNLTAAQRSACTASGFANDRACSTPDLCYQICGPKCRAFKQAIAGFDYVIHWRAR